MDRLVDLVILGGMVYLVILVITFILAVGFIVYIWRKIWEDSKEP